MPDLIFLDIHALIDMASTLAEFSEAGVVLAMTLSLDDATKVIRG
jgi:hypothetical protein